MDVLTVDDPWSQYLNEAIEKQDSISAAKQTDSTENQTDANQARGEKGSSTDTPISAQRPNIPEERWEFNIEGSEADAERILLREFLEQNRDLLVSTSVKNTAAKIAPFAMEVDEQCWNAEKANKARARLQSAAKDAAVWKFIQQAIADGLIVPSDASSWSQVLLTLKPNGKWRFCFWITGS